MFIFIRNSAAKFILLSFGVFKGENKNLEVLFVCSDYGYNYSILNFFYRGSLCEDLMIFINIEFHRMFTVDFFIIFEKDQSYY